MLNILIAILLFACGNAWGENATVAISTALSGELQNCMYAEPYATTRDNASASNPSHSVLGVGQFKSYLDENNHYTVMRAALAFPSIPEMSDASACTLYVDGSSDQSNTDFIVYVFGAEAIGSTFEAADYARFNGRRVGTTHNGTQLNASWNTSGYSAGWNALIFNAAGLDSVVAASGDTLKIMLVSSGDYANTAPSAVENNFVKFTIGTAYLSINYTPPGYSGTVFGVENPSIIFGLPKANVTSVMGVE